MNTNQQQIETDVIPDKQNMARMVHTAFLVVTAGLFHATKLDANKTAVVASHIKGFITRADDPYKNFSAFCQRILMVRRYLAFNKGFQIRFNIETWLNPEVARGFAGTAAWFDRLLYSRKEHPIHLLELKAFPEAILELAEEGTREIFDYWYDWFGEKKATDIREMMKLVALQMNLPAHAYINNLHPAEATTSSNS